MAATTSLSLYSKKKAASIVLQKVMTFPKTPWSRKRVWNCIHHFTKENTLKKLPWSVISKKIDDTFYTQPLLTTKRRESFYVKVTKPPNNKPCCKTKKTVLVKNQLIIDKIPSLFLLLQLHQNPVYVENRFIFLLLFSDDQPFRIDANFSVKNYIMFLISNRYQTYTSGQKGLHKRSFME